MDFTVHLRKYIHAETVIAEKFHAMVNLGSINSRMKDVFEIYTIFMTYTLGRENLRNAIHGKFEIRNTLLDSDVIIFTTDIGMISKRKSKGNNTIRS